MFDLMLFRIIAVHLTNKWPQSLHLMHLRGSALTPSNTLDTANWGLYAVFISVLILVFRNTVIFFVSLVFTIECLNILFISITFSPFFLLENSDYCNIPVNGVHHVSPPNRGSYVCGCTFTVCFFFNHNKILFNLKQYLSCWSACVVLVLQGFVENNL